MWIWSIIGDSIGGILLAILLSIIGVGLYIWLIGAVVGRRSMGAVALVGSFLWILVTFQSVLMAVGITAKRYVSRAKGQIEQVVSYAQSQTSELNTEELIDRVCNKVPLVERLVDVESLKHLDSKQISDGVVSQMNRTVSSYIRRRIYWTVGFCVAALVLVLILPGDTTATNVPARSNRAGRSRARTEPVRRSSRSRRYQ